MEPSGLPRCGAAARRSSDSPTPVRPAHPVLRPHDICDGSRAALVASRRVSASTRLSRALAAIRGDPLAALAAPPPSRSASSLSVCLDSGFPLRGTRHAAAGVSSRRAPVRCRSTDTQRSPRSALSCLRSLRTHHAAPLRDLSRHISHRSHQPRTLHAASPDLTPQSRLCRDAPATAVTALRFVTRPRPLSQPPPHRH
jgi:hypothetical protein